MTPPPRGIYAGKESKPHAMEAKLRIGFNNNALQLLFGLKYAANLAPGPMSGK
jgi:hypothetical protein